ncbi:MAG: class IV adenylate cyclase [Niabella sp.]
MPVNVEFKAKASDIKGLEVKLSSLSPTFIGEDHQIDTYFNVPKGRLKLREGNIENALIYYEREDTNEAKQSNVLLYRHSPDAALKEMLIKVHGTKTIVDKRRRIYFVDNVKIHFDEVKGLGTFIEVEAISQSDEKSLSELRAQCDKFSLLFQISKEDYISCSYSDMLPKKR